MLAAIDISVKYQQRTVLDRVSLAVRRGKITTLLGPNGAGKTTLLRALNGTVKIDAGRVELDGKDLLQLSRREIARNVSVVAQESASGFPVTVSEFVLSGRFAAAGRFGFETEHDIEAAEKAIADCRLTELQHRRMNQLSGGERQRVVLARALATNASVLLLDEPTANLDLANQAEMIEIVRRRCEQDNVAALMIVHDIYLAAEFAGYAALMKSGAVVAEGVPDEILTESRIFEVFGVRRPMFRR